MTSISCPCGSQQNYSECCQPLHNGTAQASSPEQLMRSRFSAFYLGARGEHSLADYLINTHHSSMREIDDKAVLIDNFSHQNWCSLKVLRSALDRKDQSRGQVEFYAFFTLNGEQDNPQQLHELSDFVFENGQWFYLSGSMLKELKLGRNDACWCGSGRKMKQCHGS